MEYGQKECDACTDLITESECYDSGMESGQVADGTFSLKEPPGTARGAATCHQVHCLGSIWKSRQEAQGKCCLACLSHSTLVIHTHPVLPTSFPRVCWSGLMLVVCVYVCVRACMCVCGVLMCVRLCVVMCVWGVEIQCYESI